MNLGICRKCTNWCERIRLEDKLRMAVLWAGCFLPDGAHMRLTFRDDKYATIRNCIRRARKKHGNSNCNDCNWNDARFRKILECIKNEHDAIIHEIEDSHAVEKCPFHMEQELSEWN